MILKLFLVRYGFSLLSLRLTFNLSLSYLASFFVMTQVFVAVDRTILAARLMRRSWPEPIQLILKHLKRTVRVASTSAAALNTLAPDVCCAVFYEYFNALSTTV